MSRSYMPVTENTVFHGGNDHAIGRFIDITDRRFASHESDQQGEGYVLEYSDMFGITTNFINATMEDLKKGTEHLQTLVESFIATLS